MIPFGQSDLEGIVAHRRIGQERFGLAQKPRGKQVSMSF